MFRKGVVLKVGGMVIVLMVGGLVYSNATGGNGDKYCRTKAGYIRLSNSGECRRSETAIGLPTADDYNALMTRVDQMAKASGDSGDTGELLKQVSNMQASISDLHDRNLQLSSDNETLTAKVNDLWRRLPNAIEVRGELLYPGALITNFNLLGADLAGVNLSGAKFFGWGSLEGVKLRGSNLQGASFSANESGGITLYNADLNGAILRNATFSYIASRYADFSDVQASGLNVSDSIFTEAIFRRADLRNARLLTTDLSGTDFTDADLRGASLGSRCSWSGGDGICYGWSEPVSVEGADFSGARLDGIVTSRLVGTPLALPDGWALQDGTFVQKP